MKTIEIARVEPKKRLTTGKELTKSVILFITSEKFANFVAASSLILMLSGIITGNDMAMLRAGLIFAIGLSPAAIRQMTAGLRRIRLGVDAECK